MALQPHHFSILPNGPLAWMLNVAEDTPASELHHFTCQLDQLRWPALREWVLGHHTILIITRTPISRELLTAQIAHALTLGIAPAASTQHHTIPLSYDGPDLLECADRLGITPDELIRRHSSPTYTIRFMGFSPGFAYLDGLDPSLSLPRRDSPRAKVNPGAIAIGGPYAGIYSTASPGGWHWLGNTCTRLFFPERPHSPYLFQPGDTLRFQPIP